jgi:hypothetical protein
MNLHCQERHAQQLITRLAFAAIAFCRAITISMQMAVHRTASDAATGPQDSFARFLQANDSARNLRD